MKLYDVPRGSTIKVSASDVHPPAHRDFEEGEILKFMKIDGMYSYCVDSNGEPVHLAAFANVEVIDE